MRLNPVRNRRVRILLIPKRVAAEVYGKSAVRIPAQRLFKGDLVGDPRLVISALPVGKGDRAAALQPCGNSRALRRIGDKAGRCQQQVVVHIVARQLRQASRPAGRIGLGAPLGGNGKGRLLRSFFLRT